ncbi:MAG: hypothetical protein WC806_01470 [Candidatus Gracilibacteria bacterium]
MIDFSSSALLLAIYEKNMKIDDNKINDFFNKILKISPVAIHFCGKNGRKYFDLIFNNKSFHKNKKCIMTYLTEDNKIINWIKDACWSVCPCGSRFDEWKDYRIIIINNHLIYNKICKKISEFLKGSYFWLTNAI